MEPPTAGKREDIARNLAPEALHIREDLLQLRRVEHHQRRGGRGAPCLLGRKKTSGHPPVIKGDVIGPVILKRPAEERGEKPLVAARSREGIST